MTNDYVLAALAEQHRDARLAEAAAARLARRARCAEQQRTGPTPRSSKRHRRLAVWPPLQADCRPSIAGDAA
jgi:hypothetical protein